MYDDDWRFKIFIGAIVVGAVFGFYYLIKVTNEADKRETAEISARCAEYSRMARSHSDSLSAMMNCDRLIADKKNRDNARANAAMMAGAIAGAGANAAASYRYPPR